MMLGGEEDVSVESKRDLTDHDGVVRAVSKSEETDRKKRGDSLLLEGFSCLEVPLIQRRWAMATLTRHMWKAAETLR